MLVFHAGPHKTATSYLQENLRLARRSLQARGWCYPRQGTGSSAGHHEIAHAEPDWLEPGGAGRKRLAGVPHGPSLVFSAEGAARWAPERYHALADVLGRDQIDVVQALRDPIDLFYSHWSEQIKQGQTWGLAERMAEHFADPWSSGLLNPLPVLEALRDDPRIRLHVIPFEVLKTRGLDIFEHFCAAVLGLDDIKAAKTTPRNVALPILQVEFLRLLTLLAAGDARRIDSSLRRRFIHELSEPTRRALGQLLRDHGRPARRRVEFPAPHPFKTELEARVRVALKDCWTLDPGAAPLYGRAPQSYVYYEAFGLMRSPEIAEAVEGCLARLGSGGRVTRGLIIGLAKFRNGIEKMRGDNGRDD